MASISPDGFRLAAAQARNDHPQATLAIPVAVRLLADQLTPAVAYRRTVADDPREAPSFLFESVENGESVGRYSLMGASPAIEISATGSEVIELDHHADGKETKSQHADPLEVLRERAGERGGGIVLCRAHADRHGTKLPGCALGGWFGYAGYDTVRYAEPGRLHRDSAPPDDRDLPEMQFGLYDGVTAFDHVSSVVDVVQLAMIAPGEAYERACEATETRASRIESAVKVLPAGRMRPDEPPVAMASNMTRKEHAAMVARAQEYIRAGDVFQVVLGQRFERVSQADPFDVYRALRSVNPSPYMVYLQTRGCIMVASSPEILCRVSKDSDGTRIVTNRPLAGTRKRGATPEQDAAMAAELLADEKERAEHTMLVDLGRNDVGVVARPASVKLKKIMEIERYSHVMHLSSTVTGELRDGLDAWDALRAALPVGTISGAPKIRAMQIIDELEPVRRGPYGGGMGYVDLEGNMDIALALRTIVVPTAARWRDADGCEGGWTYHVQAAGGIVLDSQADAEYAETVNKAAALGRAIDVAESAFGHQDTPALGSGGPEQA